MDVETVCTEAQLAEYLGGQLTGVSSLLPKGWTDATQARTQALEEVLEALRRRTPPIGEAVLSDATQLRRAVKYGAEKWLLWYAMTAAGDQSVMAFRYNKAERRFHDEISGLTPTVSGGLRGNTSGPSISRR